MPQINPQPYRRFISALQFMEAYVPFEPTDPNSTFMIFSSSGSGYYPKGCGPRCAFTTRDDADWVPAKEIEKTLMMLKIPVEHYLETINALYPESPVLSTPDMNVIDTIFGTGKKKE